MITHDPATYWSLFDRISGAALRRSGWRRNARRGFARDILAEVYASRTCARSESKSTMVWIEAGIDASNPKDGGA